MKRPIHFRAWFVAGDNHEIKVMLEGVTVYDSGNIGMCDDDFVNETKEQIGFTCTDDELFVKDGVEIDLTKFKCYRGDDWMHFEGELMMDSGFRDKANNTIYEGDIIEVGNLRSPVTFENGCFMWGDELLGLNVTEIGFDVSDPSKWALVIGNIYQNPDLLK